jgi:hypothetical protein
VENKAFFKAKGKAYGLNSVKFKYFAGEKIAKSTK